MIKEINTNLANFNKISDLLHYMKDEKINEVTISRFQLWSGENLEMFCKRFTIDELQAACRSEFNLDVDKKENKVSKAAKKKTEIKTEDGKKQPTVKKKRAKSR